MPYSITDLTGNGGVQAFANYPWTQALPYQGYDAPESVGTAENIHWIATFTNPYVARFVNTAIAPDFLSDISVYNDAFSPTQRIAPIVVVTNSGSIEHRDEFTSIWIPVPTVDPPTDHCNVGDVGAPQLVGAQTLPSAFKSQISSSNFRSEQNILHYSLTDGTLTEKIGLRYFETSTSQTETATYPSLNENISVSCVDVGIIANDYRWIASRSTSTDNATITYDRTRTENSGYAIDKILIPSPETLFSETVSKTTNETESIPSAIAGIGITSRPIIKTINYNATTCPDAPGESLVFNDAATGCFYLKKAYVFSKTKTVLQEIDYNTSINRIPTQNTPNMIFGSSLGIFGGFIDISSESNTISHDYSEVLEEFIYTNGTTEINFGEQPSTIQFNANYSGTLETGSTVTFSPSTTLRLPLRRIETLTWNGTSFDRTYNSYDYGWSTLIGSTILYVEKVGEKYNHYIGTITGFTPGAIEDSSTLAGITENSEIAHDPLIQTQQLLNISTTITQTVLGLNSRLAANKQLWVFRGIGDSMRWINTFRRSITIKTSTQPGILWDIYTSVLGTITPGSEQPAFAQKAQLRTDGSLEFSIKDIDKKSAVLIGNADRNDIPYLKYGPKST